MANARAKKSSRPVSTTPDTVEVVGYVRVSTVEQTKGNGLSTQRERIAAWCAYQDLGAAVIEADEGLSGGNTESRPAFQAAMRRALSLGKRGVLVVYKLDRLGRNSLDIQETLAVLLDAGVRVVSIADGIDSASDMGATVLKLLTSILATFADLEKTSITTRLQDGRKRASAADKVYAVEPAYGRRVVDEEEGLLGVAEEEAAAVARIHELHDAGTSYRKIAAALLEEGHKPRRGAAWSVSVLHRIATGVRRRRPVGGSTKRVERVRAEYLAVAPSAPASPPKPVEVPARALTHVLKAITRASKRSDLVRIPELARELGSDIRPVLLELARQEQIELRAESSVGLLPAGDAELCPKGWQGETLSYCRLK